MMLKKLGNTIVTLFADRSTKDVNFFDNLEDILIEGDMGSSASTIVSQIRNNQSMYTTQEELLAFIQEIIANLLLSCPLPSIPDNDPLLLLMLGVNGTGKTTTGAKLAHYYSKEITTDAIVMAAGDTFRAAAVEQLQIHAQRLSCRFVNKGAGADAGAVIYDSIQSARSKKDKLIIADTAGRMHNKSNLVQELKKMVGIVEKQGLPYKKIVVLDATTGQNALAQAEVFHQEVGVDMVILTKCDSSARGGILLPIAHLLSLGCVATCNGENYDDFMVFDKKAFARNLLFQD